MPDGRDPRALGQILIDDQPVRFTGPGDAMAAGIGMVHQHFALADNLSVLVTAVVVTDVEKDRRR